MHLLRYAASVALVVFLGFSSCTATAGPGDLDSNFGQGGRVASDFKGSNGFAYAVALQSDEKIVTAGIRFVGISAEGGDFVITRYNPDGTLDNRFGQRRHAITDFGLTEIATAVAVQPDGKIIAAGGTYAIFSFLGGQFALYLGN